MPISKKEKQIIQDSISNTHIELLQLKFRVENLELLFHEFFKLQSPKKRGRPLGSKNKK
jgi:hypothetical protein